MSGDDGEADFGFDYKQGLKLINPSTQNATNLFNAPLKLPKKIEENESQQAYEPSHQVFKFTESFLEENEEAPGFGENSSANDNENENREDEDSVELDWDASTIFKNLACSENKKISEESVCVLRLHDILTKSELGVQKISRQLIECGKLISQYTPQERRDLGFLDKNNKKNLLQDIRSLRANTNLLNVELDCLQEVLEPSGKSAEKSNSNLLWLFLSAGVISAGFLAFRQKKLF
uniref:Uncharacterized protein n=1 Tax=Caenorhabditis japonica TaxID=281687 RepID=A0A8R1DKQ5_CAEJA